MFVDSKDRKWEIRISTPVLIKVCRKLGLTLNSIIEMKIQVADILEAVPVVLEGQLKERGLTGDDFLEELEPKDLSGLLSALMTAFQEAFPQIKGAKGDGASPFVLGESKTS